MTTRTYEKHTHVYKTHLTTEIQLDVYLPPDQDSNTPKPILLWFHGGYLITGSRKAIPGWLHHHALSQNWTLISADYRVLPESTGLATIEDVIVAYEWVAGGSLRRLHPNCTADPGQIILAGASAGGWCALVTALHFTSPSVPAEQTGQTPLPPPKALWLLYPLLDLGSQKWAQSVYLPGAMAVDPATAENLLHRVSERIARSEISVGEDFPSSEEEMRTRKRLPLLYLLLERGVFLDFLTGQTGFGERVVGLGLDGAVAEPGYGHAVHVRGLFPLDYGVLGPGFPATVVVHGTDDREVSCGESERLVATLQEGGAEVQYFPVNGADHVFDLELREGSLESKEGGEAGATLVRAMRALQKYLEK
ncbi:hypothetical protein ASPACDRAFT_1887659 [Aspergillus aculeatus ATCC 16872]|uniref:Alpha/beta hydrolase fold-3 domain-containing protein n=1 Tax=Aspergillus aculeatus (strain ATCC 16872 / CBS 172.66 / WB 5094) TaxID=690307 RepID=A0A1L9WXS6_ASPA1|nr:uncharacterized protein ASPACDRAFT_1887659 [Aspergillus aculeatus ATCC 16872]OJK00943.1 hypothetical protein ASPACDRAFT_1887659 [Aspergillus aculeatus ATCC 16872]